jgi:hypothetical protein
MAKFKVWKTIDCVVGGLYRNETPGLSTRSCWDFTIRKASCILSAAPAWMAALPKLGRWSSLSSAARASRAEHRAAKAGGLERSASPYR